MSSVGSNIAQSIAGLSQAERLQPRTAKAPKDAKALRRDAAERIDTVETTQAADAVKNIAENTQEEAREDHEENPTAQSDAEKPPRPSLDVSG
jgi:hypothetical protein